MQKTSSYLLSAALVGSLGLNVAQSGAIGEARAGITENKPVCTPYMTQVETAGGSTIDVTPAALASATFDTVAEFGLRWLNDTYEPASDWTINDVAPQGKVEAVFGPSYTTGAALRVCLWDEFTTVAGAPAE